MSLDDHRNKAESIHHKFIQSLKERYLNDNRLPDRLIYKWINRYKGYLNIPRDPLATNNCRVGGGLAFPELLGRGSAGHIGELPSPRVYEYLEDLAEEIEVAKRYGKPYSNTIEADRFALSAETLRQSQALVRVIAGFLRQSIFKADPPNDNIEVHYRSERPTTANIGRAIIATDGIDIDPRSLRPNPLVTSAARTHNAAATTLPANILPPFGIMTITVGGTTRVLDQPIYNLFIKDFSTGLFNNNFNV
ncbi:unnamed protein product [Penicillium roqueforti FM164]|uniref:Genomic scaffold, ProqFM164S02 n=1 Tax=Penicillium roqueforti (strain FM164) TaxID=1365484 RepID=W6QT78_PENRF|nr:unnamed protein product [Penicillium roqueforti FM164]